MGFKSSNDTHPPPFHHQRSILPCVIRSLYSKESLILFLYDQLLVVDQSSLMNRLKAKFSKKSDATPLTAATKEFIKGTGDVGLGALPEILEACSSAANGSLASQVEVLDLITKYYGQDSHLGRQLRCIDLLRYLSDQRDNELFNILSQGHPLIRSLDTNLRNSRSAYSVQKQTRLLLDHLVRQPNVPESIVELHAKHVNGITKPHKPTIILSDQEVVADDLKAAEAETELLSTLLTDTNVDESLLSEVHDRLVSTKQRLIRDVDTSTNEQQTVNLISSIETSERVLNLYREMRPGDTSSSSRRPSIATSNVSADDVYAAPIRQSDRRQSGEHSRSPARSNGKGRASPPASPEAETESYPTFATSQGDSSGATASAAINDLPTQPRTDSIDDNFGEGNSHAMDVFGIPPTSASSQPATIEPSFAPSTPPRETKPLRLSSNNPFAKSPPQLDLSPISAKNPFTDVNAMPTPALPGGVHSEGDLDEQWRTLKL